MIEVALKSEGEGKRYGGVFDLEFVTCSRGLVTLKLVGKSDVEEFPSGMLYRRYWPSGVVSISTTELIKIIASLTENTEKLYAVLGKLDLLTNVGGLGAQVDESKLNSVAPKPSD